MGMLLRRHRVQPVEAIEVPEAVAEAIEETPKEVPAEEVEEVQPVEAIEVPEETAEEKPKATRKKNGGE